MPYGGKGRYTIFTLPTQHFGIDSLNELTEERILNEINVESWTGANRKFAERKINGLRKVKLEKILNQNNND